MTTRKTGETPVPVQLGWRSPTPEAEDRLRPFARWAQVEGYWYAEQWPPLGGHLAGTERRDGDEPEMVLDERRETLMRAIAVGREGIIVVHDEPRDEQDAQSDDGIARIAQITEHWHADAVAMRIEAILTEVRSAWRRRECLIPIRVATLTRRDIREFTDLSAKTSTIDRETIEEWQEHWSFRETISPTLACEAWEAFLPHTTRRRGQPRESARRREAILRQALNPSRNHGLDTEARARAAGLRSVLRAMEADRELHGEFLLPKLAERDRKIAEETISFVCLTHLNMTLDRARTTVDESPHRT